MVVAVRKIGNDFVIPEQAVRGLHLVDGSRIEVAPVTEQSAARRYITSEDALRVFEETLPNHEEAYRELAK